MKDDVGDEWFDQAGHQRKIDERSGTVEVRWRAFAHRLALRCMALDPDKELPVADDLVFCGGVQPYFVCGGLRILVDDGTFSLRAYKFVPSVFNKTTVLRREVFDVPVWGWMPGPGISGESYTVVKVHLEEVVCRDPEETTRRLHLYLINRA